MNTIVKVLQNGLPTVALVLLIILMLHIFMTSRGFATDANDSEDSGAIYGIYYDSLHEIATYLRENGWVSELVDDDQLEYELLLIEQLSSMTDRVSPALAIAQVALESRFNPDAQNNGAIGLMQIVPTYHQQTLNDICEEPTFDKWYEPRYNIMVGLTYMDELLSNEYACGDNTYALMMYNQGPTSGTKTYLAKGIVSAYASTIINLKQEIELIMEKGETLNGTPS